MVFLLLFLFCFLLLLLLVSLFLFCFQLKGCCLLPGRAEFCFSLHMCTVCWKKKELERIIFWMECQMFFSLLYTLQVPDVPYCFVHPPTFSCCSHSQTRMQNCVIDYPSMRVRILEPTTSGMRAYSSHWSGQFSVPFGSQLVNIRHDDDSRVGNGPVNIAHNFAWLAATVSISGPI